MSCNIGVANLSYTWCSTWLWSDLPVNGTQLGQIIIANKMLQHKTILSSLPFHIANQKQGIALSKVSTQVMLSIW